MRRNDSNDTQVGQAQAAYQDHIFREASRILREATHGLVGDEGQETGLAQVVANIEAELRRRVAHAEPPVASSDAE